MAILESELVFYPPEENSSASTNGGRPDETSSSPSGQYNNTWPNVFSDERDLGSNLLRKKFIKIENTSDLALQITKMFFHKPTDGDDYVKMFAGTMRNTQGDLSSPREYGTSVLKTSVSSGTTIVVTIEDSSETGLFQDGDLIVLHNKVNPTDVAGTREFLTITGSPVYVGDEVTITTVESVANSYVADAAYVSSVVEFGTIQTAYDNLVVTSSSGTFDDTTYPITLNNMGCIEQTWTITFNAGGTTFTCSGDTVGAVESGNITEDYEPSNPNTYNYFTIEFEAFGGTFAQDETIVFQTHPAMIPLWQRRVVPAGSSSQSTNDATLVIVGESE
jgi:hypothetical protein